MLRILYDSSLTPPYLIFVTKTITENRMFRVNLFELSEFALLMRFYTKNRIG